MQRIVRVETARWCKNLSSGGSLIDVSGTKQSATEALVFVGREGKGVKGREGMGKEGSEGNGREGRKASEGIGGKGAWTSICKNQNLCGREEAEAHIRDVLK